LQKFQDTQVTQLLSAAAQGDSAATDALFPVVYDELRRLAGSLLGHERAGHTLQPTALVHEAYLRLLGPDGAQLSWQNRAHFFGAAARAMRRILIDRARHVKATRVEKARLPDDSLLPAWSVAGRSPADVATELVELDEAMESLKAKDDRQHEIVMLRFFGGLSVEQTADALGLGVSTVKNEWAFARAWLLREIDRAKKNPA
jgi:RNA polymerase sigma-70 factor, ECF subfamily